MKSCKDVTGLVASGRLAEAGVFERVAIRFHLLMCGYCRCYARQIERIGDHARSMCADAAPLSDEARQALAERCAKAAAGGED